MRPVVKGDWPQESGNNIIYTEYGQARPILMDERIGDYCSYCENQITNPAIEHIHGKSEVPGVALNWYNFLLGCVNCNSIKGSDYLDVNDYYWPDVHNTHLLFDFHPLGLITLKATYPANIDRARVQRTYNLTGLGRYGSITTDADRRYIKRSQAWGKATNALAYYEGNDQPNDFITIITNNATSTGFWSVWINVFDAHIVVQDALIIAFLRTYSDCIATNINRL